MREVTITLRMTDKTTPIHPNWKNPAHIFALGFGSGMAPFAPGTFGTFVAVPVVWCAQQGSSAVYVALTLIMFFVGVYVCGVTARDLRVHDHAAIVWDEIVGYMITMTFAPHGWLWLLGGFVAFRVFDILKPWPIRTVDRKLHGGFGIMLDDVLAGVYAGFVLYGAELGLAR